jgi:serine/threonine-protein kinase
MLIASAAALPVLLAACRGVQALGTPPPPPADVGTLRDAIAHETALVASYAALTASAGSGAAGASGAGASGPGSAGAGSAGAGSAGAGAGGRVAAALAVVLADHRQHLAKLKSRLVEPAGHSPAAAAGATGAVGPSGFISTIAQLEQAEQAASDRLIAQLAGLPPTLAQLFASIAASEAAHVPYLKAARRGR